jgi:hypothetical protein
MFRELKQVIGVAGLGRDRAEVPGKISDRKKCSSSLSPPIA